jgi:hypothetical protein
MANILSIVDKNGIELPISASGGGGGVTDFDELTGRPRANGQFMNSSTNLLIQQMAAGAGINLVADGGLLRINSEAYKLLRLTQNDLLENSIAPLYLDSLIPVGSAAIISVVGTCDNLPENPSDEMFGLISRGDSTGDFTYLLVNPTNGVVYTALGHPADEEIEWNIREVVTDFDELTNRPSANGVVMDSTTDLFIPQIIAGQGVTLSGDGTEVEINSESYRLIRLTQDDLVGNSISPVNLETLVPAGTAALVSVLGTCENLPPTTSDELFGTIMRSESTGNFAYMIIDPTEGFVYSAIGEPSDIDIQWILQKNWYDSEAHPDPWDVLEAPLFSVSDGTSLNVAEGEIEYNFNDWSVWTNITVDSHEQTEVVIQWEENGDDEPQLHLKYAEQDVIIATKDIEAETAQTSPGTYDLGAPVGVRVNGAVNSRWAGLITVDGCESQRVDLKGLHSLIQEIQLSDNNAFNELFLTVEGHTVELSNIYNKQEIDELVSGSPYQGLFEYAAELEETFPEGVEGDKAIELSTNKVFTKGAETWDDGVVVEPFAGAYYDVKALLDEANEPGGKVTYNGESWDVLSYGAQLQADFTQTTESAADYIKNKPENLVQDANYVHTDLNFTSALKQTYDEKQAALIGTVTSGQNLKTVGGTTLLGTGNIAMPTVDQTYGATSSNAQSGVAVAQGLATIANKVQSGGTFTTSTLNNGQWGGIY